LIKHFIIVYLYCLKLVINSENKTPSLKMLQDPLIPPSHEHFMKQAIAEAEKALAEEEVPVGAIVVLQNRIIARGYNQVEKLNDCTAHAEMIALTSAFNFLGAKYLPEATLYVTVEPCCMCSGALYWSKIGAVVYGTPDEKNGGLNFVQLHPKTKVQGNIMANECKQLMTDFFQKKR
jgi:tRNA(adenine34) deaminase